MRSSLYGVARAHFEKAYDIDKIRRKPRVATELMYLADIAQILSNSKKSLVLLQGALEVFREVKDRKGEANALFYIGGNYRDGESREKAEAAFNGSLAIWMGLNQRGQQLEVLSGLLTLYSYQNERAKLITTAQRLLPLSIELKNREAEVHALHMLGKAYEEQQQPVKAIPYYERCLPIYLQLKWEDNVIQVLFDLMDCYRATKQPELAITRGESAMTRLITMYQQIGSPVSESAIGFYSLFDMMDNNIAVLSAILDANGRDADAQAARDWRGQVMTKREGDKVSGSDIKSQPMQ